MLTIDKNNENSPKVRYEVDNMEVTIVTDLKTGFAIFNFLLYSIMAKVHIVDRGRAAECLILSRNFHMNSTVLIMYWYI